MENEHVLSNLDKSIPNFKSLFSKLTPEEKTRFKPIVQIVAHSLQFLKKIISLDQKYNFLQKDYNKFVSTTNQSLDQSLEVDKSHAEMLEKQLSIMQQE
jgi:expansin (peptidoglycan-binding protein)